MIGVLIAAIAILYLRLPGDESVMPRRYHYYFIDDTRPGLGEFWTLHLKPMRAWWIGFATCGVLIGGFGRFIGAGSHSGLRVFGATVGAMAASAIVWFALVAAPWIVIPLLIGTPFDRLFKSTLGAPGQSDRVTTLLLPATLIGGPWGGVGVGKLRRLSAASSDHRQGCAHSTPVWVGLMGLGLGLILGLADHGLGAMATWTSYAPIKTYGLSHPAPMPFYVLAGLIFGGLAGAVCAWITKSGSRE